MAVLRREIARAAVMTAPEDDLPLISIAEAELSFSYVIVALEGEEIVIDASIRALAEAPAAAVQRMRLRMVDADMALALHEKG